MKQFRPAFVAAALIIGGCEGHQSAPPQAARTMSVADRVEAYLTPVVISQGDPCYARVAAETRKMLGIAPTRITRSANIRFVAGTTEEHIIVVYSAGDKSPPCQHLVAVTVVPPARTGEMVLKFPEFSVRQVDVKPSLASGRATLIFTDRAGRHFVGTLVRRPFAFIVNYNENYLDLLTPGPDLITHEISSETNGRILYRVSFKHGFSIGSPVYHL